MILFDTSVIIDARDGHSPWQQWAETQIAQAVSSEGAAVNTIVLAEASVRALLPDTVPAALLAMGMDILDLPAAAAIPASKAYAVYLQRRKQDVQSVPKTPLPDFLIGAHAEVSKLSLATRDPDRIRTYFPQVKLLVP